jgi:TPR repeat protein
MEIATAGRKADGRRAKPKRRTTEARKTAINRKGTHQNTSRRTIKAVEQGYSEAQSELARWYYFGFGEGMSQDFGKAVYWYTKAAENGDLGAQYVLMSIYYWGKKGLPADKGKATYWYTKATGKSNATYQDIEEELSTGKGSPIDPRRDLANRELFKVFADARNISKILLK